MRGLEAGFVALVLISAVPGTVSGDDKAGSTTMEFDTGTIRRFDRDASCLRELRLLRSACEDRYLAALQTPAGQRLQRQRSVLDGLAKRRAEAEAELASARLDYKYLSKDEFETTAQFQRRQSAARAKVTDCESRVKALTGEIAKVGDVEKDLDELRKNATIPVRLGLTTIDPTYDADKRSLRCPVATVARAEKQDGKEPGLHEWTRELFTACSVQAAIGSKVPNTLSFENIPDIETAKSIKRALSGGSGLALQGSANVRYCESTTERGAIAARLALAERRTTEHKYVFNFTDSVRVVIPSLSQDFRNKGVTWSYSWSEKVE